jgi:hypothetical protein
LHQLDGVCGRKLYSQKLSAMLNFARVSVRESMAAIAYRDPEVRSLSTPVPPSDSLVSLTRVNQSVNI